MVDQSKDKTPKEPFIKLSHIKVVRRKPGEKPVKISDAAIRHLRKQAAEERARDSKRGNDKT